MSMNAKSIRAFMGAGHAIFTIQSVPTGKHFTYYVARKGAALFARVLTGDDNYDYLGVVYLTTGLLLPTSASRYRAGAPSFDALAWFLRVLAKTPHDQIPKDVIFRHAGKCGRCGRTLTHPESLDTGLGPECSGRI
jgi:hypothetical protein